MAHLIKRIYKLIQTNTDFYKNKTPLFNKTENKTSSFYKEKKEDYKNIFSENKKEPVNNVFLPDSIIADLNIFGLSPPVTMETIKKARNREIKKYHSDKFLHDQQKLIVSKQIMQIYNAAFSRLSIYFDKNSHQTAAKH